MSRPRDEFLQVCDALLHQIHQSSSYANEIGYSRRSKLGLADLVDIRHNGGVQKRPTHNLKLIKSVLGSNYIELHLDKLAIEEDPNDELAKVNLRLTDNSGNQISVEGTGVGPVDAIFSALLERYGPEYQSLRSIELEHFNVGAQLDTKTARAGVDAVGEVTLGVLNSEGKLFEFSDTSRSISRSAARAVLAAVEYFVNAERAFITLHRSRKDAKERNRVDLVTRYTRELAEVVKSTSFTEVIESMKKDV